jgi:hypothetical protein
LKILEKIKGESYHDIVDKFGYTAFDYALLYDFRSIAAFIKYFGKPKNVFGITDKNYGQREKDPYFKRSFLLNRIRMAKVVGDKWLYDTLTILSDASKVIDPKKINPKNPENIGTESIDTVATHHTSQSREEESYDFLAEFDEVINCAKIAEYVGTGANQPNEELQYDFSTESGETTDSDSNDCDSQNGCALAEANRNSLQDIQFCHLTDGQIVPCFLRQVSGDGNCGFSALGITRQQFIEDVIRFAGSDQNYYRGIPGNLVDPILLDADVHHLNDWEHVFNKITIG